MRYEQPAFTKNHPYIVEARRLVAECGSCGVFVAAPVKSSVVAATCSDCVSSVTPGNRKASRTSKKARHRAAVAARS